VVTGLAPVGDAWACTNPSAGRGMSLGLMQAQVMRQVTAAHLDDPATLARVYALRTEREVAPYYRNQVRADRQRVAEMVAIREGREPPAPDPTTARFLAAARTDATGLYPGRRAGTRRGRACRRRSGRRPDAGRVVLVGRPVGHGCHGARAPEVLGRVLSWLALLARPDAVLPK